MTFGDRVVGHRVEFEMQFIDGHEEIVGVGGKGGKPIEDGGTILFRLPRGGRVVGRGDGAGRWIQ